MARPATPRKDAEDRYSPEMADAFSVAGTWRAATKKSAGVRATRTPRAPMIAVSAVTAMMATMEAGSVRPEPVPRPGSVLLEELDELALQAPRPPHVPVAEEDEGWVD